MHATLYNFFATTMRDDRARKVRCQHVDGAPASEPRPRDQLLSILTVVSVLCMLFIVVQICAWLLTLMMPQLSNTLPLSRPTWISVVVVIAMVLQFWPGQVVRAQRANDRREVLLSQGRCGACGYDLSSVAPASDSMHQCPECSAAWALEAWKPLPDGSASDYAKSRRNN